MFDWILNTPLVKVVKTQIRNIFFQIIQAIFWNLLFFASPFLYISDITLQRLSLFSNSEINISVAPWSSFYALKTSCTKQLFADVFKIDVLMIWRPSTLLKRDSNTGVFLWISRNLYEQLFYRTPPLAASALNFILYFQVVNSGCTVWIRKLLFTRIDISCSFICGFIFVIFSSHVEILILIGSFSSN